MKIVSGKTLLALGLAVLLASFALALWRRRG